MPVGVLLCGRAEQQRLLRTGRADVATLHCPFDDTRSFDTEELLTEGQVAILPAGHPLTTRRDLRLAELDGSYPDGPGPEVRDHARLRQLVALGRTLTGGPEPAQSQVSDDVVAVPVLDAPEVTTVIA